MGFTNRSANWRSGALVLLIVFCSLLGRAQSSPQTQELMQAAEGQKVVSVVLAGRPDIGMSNFEKLIELKPGEPFSRQKVDASIAALKAAGHFQDVTVELRPQADGMNVAFTLQPALYLGVYSFPGAESRFPYSRLLQSSGYPVEQAYSIQDVQHATDGLLQLFRRTGLFLATVQPELQPHFDTGIVNVNFNVTLGKRATFGSLNMRGVTPEEAVRLRRTLSSFKARIHRAKVVPGKEFSGDRLQNAAEFLQNALAKQGHLTSEVKLAGADYDPNTNSAAVDFDVKTGPTVNVKVTGAHVRGGTQRRLIPIYQQNLLSDPVIEEGRQNLISHFQSKGYFDVNVGANVSHHANETTIVYQVQKNKRHKVDGIAVRGNRQFPSDQLLSHVVVKKGRLFSHGKYSEQLVRRSVKNLEAVYNNAGFREAKVVPQVTRSSDGDIALHFLVTEGPRNVVNSLLIEGNRSLSESKFAPNGLNLGPNKPFSQFLVQQDRNSILATYLDRGYLNANFKSIAKPIASDPHKFDVVYQINEGPRVDVARIFTIGRKHTRQSLIDITTKIKPEAPFSASELLSSESRLYSLDIFDWAEIDPRRPITTQTDEDVLIKLHESKRNSITYGFGFEVINRGGSVPSGTVAVPGLPPIGLPSNFITSEKTFWGPRGSIEYTRKNMRGRAESLSLTGLAARLNQNGGITYLIPSFRNSSWSVSASASAQHNSENPVFTATLGNAGLQFQRHLDAKKTKTLILQYSLQYTALTDLLIPALVPVSDQNVRLSTLSATIFRDTRDNVLDAHKGIFESAALSVNSTLLGSGVSFARFLGQVAYYKGLPHDIVWANSLRLGLEQPFANSFVPLSEKFFSGGGSTLRGFPLNGAGPQEVIPACGEPSVPSTCALIQVPVGGNQLLILNTEMRVPVPFIKKGLSVAGFYDGGNVFPGIGFRDLTALYSNSVGGGLRYSTPIGPIRFDVGHNLNGLPGIKSTQVFVTLGQAF